MADFLIFVFITACLFAVLWFIWDGANGFKR